MAYDELPGFVVSKMRVHPVVLWPLTVDENELSLVVAVPDGDRAVGADGDCAISSVADDVAVVVISVETVLFIEQKARNCPLAESSSERMPEAGTVKFTALSREVFVPLNIVTNVLLDVSVARNWSAMLMFMAWSTPDWFTEMLIWLPTLTTEGTVRLQLSSADAKDDRAIAMVKSIIMAKIDDLSVADVCFFMLVPSFKRLCELLNVRDGQDT